MIEQNNVHSLHGNDQNVTSTFKILKDPCILKSVSNVMNRLSQASAFVYEVIAINLKNKQTKKAPFQNSIVQL